MEMRWVRTAMAGAVLLSACGVLSAQDAKLGEPAKPQMMSKDAEPGWEVMTVKPTDPSDTHRRMVTDGRRVRLYSQTVEQLMVLGYSVQKSQIVDEPDWVSTERYDIDGLSDAEGQPNIKQVQGLLRKILVERFGLKLHSEQRVMPVYALTVAKGGAKLAKSTGDPNGQPADYGGNVNGRVSKRFENTSMPDLILTLLFYAGRPVVDQTGLMGRYEFKLQWTADEARTTEPDAPPGLFTAVQEQLGLKLEAVKAPAKVLVVDKVERPGAN
jgi:uncharacterized protein (TIGR03435 family)